MSEEMTPQRRNELADSIGYLRASSAEGPQTAAWLDDMARRFAQPGFGSDIGMDDEKAAEMAAGAAKLADMMREDADALPRYLNAVADAHGIPRPPGPNTPRERSPDEQALADMRLDDEHDNAEGEGSVEHA